MAERPGKVELVSEVGDIMRQKCDRSRGVHVISLVGFVDIPTKVPEENRQRRDDAAPH